jgi:hypothetical protein
MFRLMCRAIFRLVFRVVCMYNCWCILNTNNCTHKHVARNTTNTSNKLRVAYDYIILYNTYWASALHWRLYIVWSFSTTIFFQKPQKWHGVLETYLWRLNMSRSTGRCFCNFMSKGGDKSTGCWEERSRFWSREFLDFLQGSIILISCWQ